MNKCFEIMREEIASQSFAKDIVCFIVFGSSVVNYNMGKVPDDVDICIVVDNRNANLQQISDYLFSSFKKPDFRIYFQDEIDSNLPFMDKGVGVFAVEYFADGISLYGENLFVSKLKTLSKRKIKEAYLNKIFEYIIRIREVYISRFLTPEYKTWHTFKYVIRLSIDILLYEGKIFYDDLKILSKNEIIDLCKRYNIIKKNTEIDFDNSEKLYRLYQEINLYVVDYHTKGIKNKLKKFTRHIYRIIR